MSVRNFNVNITVEEATVIIKESVLKDSVSGTIVDQYERRIGDAEVIVLIFEKYYMRTSNRASLTVTIDNLEQKTKVHAVAAGSSDSLLRFDWGAGKNFAQSIEVALMPYMTEEAN